MKNVCFLLLVCISILSCTSDVLPEPEVEPEEPKELEEYLFLGHIYGGPTWVDARIEQLDRTQFDQIWLGGDICSETSKDSSTLNYLDDLFDLGSPNNHWAMGNHDTRNGNHHWIKAKTHREFFYSHHYRGITFIIFNTNTHIYEPGCEILNAQYDFMMSVMDTISTSSHLVLLSHHITWGDVEGQTLSQAMWETANANKPSWIANCYEGDSRYQTVVYPKLVEAQERGVQVVCLSGDYGQKGKVFQYKTNKDIWLVASGIGVTPNLPEDRVLVLQHRPDSSQLTWSFLSLDSLIVE